MFNTGAKKINTEITEKTKSQMYENRNLFWSKQTMEPFSNRNLCVTTRKHFVPRSACGWLVTCIIFTAHIHGEKTYQPPPRGFFLVLSPRATTATTVINPRVPLSHGRQNCLPNYKPSLCVTCLCGSGLKALISY